MDVIIYGIDHETLANLHNCFMPRTIITFSVWSNDDQLFKIGISSKASIFVYADNVRIAMGEKHFDLNKKDFVGIVIT